MSVRHRRLHQFQLGLERRPGEHTDQCCQERSALLVPRGDVSPDAAEGGDSLLTPQAPRDLLLHFDHADVPFCLAVLKRHGEVIQEREDLPLMVTQPIEWS